MNYTEAIQKAERLRASLEPFCRRIEIAGSVRRQKTEDIKDIELVAIPISNQLFDMFGNPTEGANLLELAIPQFAHNYRATTTKNGEKYKAIIFPDATKLDLFIVTPDTWGVQFALRTGPADYSHWLVTPKNKGGALPSYAKVEGGRVLVHGEKIETPEEADFFKFLDIPMREPKDRIAKWIGG